MTLEMAFFFFFSWEGLPVGALMGHGNAEQRSLREESALWELLVRVYVTCCHKLLLLWAWCEFLEAQKLLFLYILNII